jgi:hypothetical protein
VEDQLKNFLALLFLLVAGSANATVLYDSGTPLIDSGRCDAESCGGSMEWWVTDDFTASSDWNITGFEFFSHSRRDYSFA